MNFKWTHSREEKLRQLWSEGKSASECARMFGGVVTRNAIIGKVFRMDLPKRRPTTCKVKMNHWTDEKRAAMSAKMKARTAARAADVKKHNAVNPMVARAKSPPPAVFVPAAKDLAVGTWNPLPEAAPVGIMDLTERTCRWPVSDGAPFMFCGCQVEPGSRYCPTHKHISVGSGSRGEQRAMVDARSAAKQDPNHKKWLEAA